MTLPSIELFGHVVGFPALVAGGVGGVVFVWFALSAFVGWLRRVMMRVAFRHLIYAGLSTAGLSVGMFVPDPVGSLLGGLGSAVGSLVDLVVGGLG